MKTLYQAAAFAIAAFGIPQLGHAGIIWDLTGTSKGLAESQLRGAAAQSNSQNNNNNDTSGFNDNGNNNNNGNGNGYGTDNNDKNNEGFVVELDTGLPWDESSDEGDAGDGGFTEPLLPVETVTEPVSVPEPTSLVLLATGLLAAATVARRKRA